jgi:hypothetical protein
MKTAGGCRLSGYFVDHIGSTLRENPCSESPQGFLRLLVNPNVHHRVREPTGCNLQPPSFETHYYEVYYSLFYP